MEILRHRKESEELLMMRSLNARMHFSKDQKYQLLKMEKGFIGEQVFDAHLDQKLKMDCLILNDLLFENNNTTFQIDNLLIAQDTIYFDDVKYHEGDYLIDNKGRWYTLDKKERKDPLLQLNRGLSLFRSMLQELGITTTVVGHVIFVNPAFFLYQAPVNPTIIFPSQINRFINNLNQTPSKLRPYHTKLAERLLSLHNTKSKHTRIPEYTYDQLEKGIMCGRCGTRTTLKDRTIICGLCDYKEKVDNAVIRSIDEFILLFPDINLTLGVIHEWCNTIKSRKMMRYILQKHYRLIFQGRTSHYVQRN